MCGACSRARAAELGTGVVGAGVGGAVGANVFVGTAVGCAVGDMVGTWLMNPSLRKCSKPFFLFLAEILGPIFSPRSGEFDELNRSRKQGGIRM